MPAWTDARRNDHRHHLARVRRAHAEPHSGEVPRRHDDRKGARGRRRRRGARRRDLLGIDGLRGPRRRRLNIDLINLRLRRLDHLSLNGPLRERERDHELRASVTACWNYYRQRLAGRSADIELRARPDPRRYGHRKMPFHGTAGSVSVRLTGPYAAKFGAVQRARLYGAVQRRASVYSRRDSKWAAIIFTSRQACQAAKLASFNTVFCFAARAHVQPQGVLARHKTGI